MDPLCRLPRRLLLLSALAIGCRSVTVVELPEGAVSFDPPSFFREWWQLTEACSGRSANFDAVSWYVVPNATELPRSDGPSIQGTWLPGGNRIVLAGTAQFEGDLVRHEMLHALLGIGALGHPRSQFLRRCGGVVVCNDACVADAGPPPAADSSAPLTESESLAVSVRVVPDAPSSAAWDGAFLMIITARNARDHALRVLFPPSGDAGPPLSHEYRILGNGGVRQNNRRIFYPEVGWFDAGEVKQFIFDFRVGTGATDLHLVPGTYTFNGAYAEEWAPHPPTVTISP